MITYTNASPEFDAYPAHCMIGTNEGEMVDELKEIGEWAKQRGWICLEISG